MKYLTVTEFSFPLDLKKHTLFPCLQFCIVGAICFLEGFQEKIKPTKPVHFEK